MYRPGMFGSGTAGSGAASSRFPGASRLVAKAVALMFAAVLSMVLILVLLPNGNDFAGSTLDKHARLDAQTGRKIVFVGGSNLAFGLDSPTVERELGIPVVNMGMNAYVGLRYMLNEIRDSLNPGDMVVLALEYEIYFQPGPFDAIEGTGPDHLMLLTVRPASFRYLTTFQQVTQVAAAVPYATQQKVLRLLDASLDAIGGKTYRRSLIEEIESRSGFNAHGDLVSHLGVTWPYAFEAGEDLSQKRLNPDVIQHLRTFRDEMTARGIAVVIVPPPTPTPYYQQHHATMESVFNQLDDAPAQSINTTSRVAAYAFPMSHFFDNSNHLTREGRALRTLQMIHDIRPILTSSAMTSSAMKSSALKSSALKIGSSHTNAPRPTAAAMP